MQNIYTIFSTKLEVEEWVKKYYTEQELSVLDVNKDADSSLIIYKGNGAEAYNKALRTGRVTAEISSRIQKMQELLCKYEIPTNITTYRYVSWKEVMVLDSSTRFGKIYKYESFLSTTLLKDIYAMSEKCQKRSLILIQVPGGTKGAYIPEVNKDRPEFEILFPFGMKLKKIGCNKYRIIGE